MIARVAQHKGNRLVGRLNEFYKANSHRDDLISRYDPQKDNIGKIINFINNEFDEYDNIDFDIGYSRSFDDDLQRSTSNISITTNQSYDQRDLRNRSYSSGISQSESSSERISSKEEQINSRRGSETEPNS